MARPLPLLGLIALLGIGVDLGGCSSPGAGLADATWAGVADRRLDGGARPEPDYPQFPDRPADQEGMAGDPVADGSVGADGDAAAPDRPFPADAGLSAFAVNDVDHHRNRLLDTYTQVRGQTDRCQFWEEMTIVEKGIFLTHTDMLGHRSCMENDSVPIDQMVNGRCDATGCKCSTDTGCNCPPGSEMALDHVFKVWTINGTDPSCCSGTDCCNGGGEWHRTFFGADDKLIAYLRDVRIGLPEWDESNDFAGPHDPFTASSETQKGSPRGQTHYWQQDKDASVLSRNGVEGVLDPHIVELDNDYNILHDSNPEGTYSGTYGRAEYKLNWNFTDSGTNRGDGLPTTFAGNGAPADVAELAGDVVFAPRCGPRIVSGGVVDAATGQPDGLHPGSALRIAGSGFLPSGNEIHVRTRSQAVRIDQRSPYLVSESTGAIVIYLPTDVGSGEAYLYVVASGVLTNLAPLTIQP